MIKIHEMISNRLMCWFSSPQPHEEEKKKAGWNFHHQRLRILIDLGHKATRSF